MRLSLRLCIGVRHINEDQGPEGVIESAALQTLIDKYLDPLTLDRGGLVSMMRDKLKERPEIFGYFPGDATGKLKFDPAAPFPVQIVIDEPLTHNGHLVMDPRVAKIGDYIDQMVLTIRHLPVGEIKPGDYLVDLSKIPNAHATYPAVVEVNVEMDEPRPGVDKSLKAVITTVQGDDEATHIRLFEIIRRAFVGILPPGVTQVSDLFVGMDTITLPPPIATPGPLTDPDPLSVDPSTHPDATPRHGDVIELEILGIEVDPTDPALAVKVVLPPTMWNGKDPTPSATLWVSRKGSSPVEKVGIKASVVPAAPAQPAVTPPPAPTADPPTNS